MAWTLSGNHVSFSISNQTHRIYGECSQDPHFLDDDAYLQQRTLSDLAAYWTFCPHDASDVSIDPMGHGLAKQVNAAPDDIHFMIQYHERDENVPAAISFTVCFPPAIFKDYLDLWTKFAVSGTEFRYVILFDFFGFSPSDSNHECLSFEKWMHKDWKLRKPVFGKGVKVAFHPKRSALLDERSRAAIAKNVVSQIMDQLDWSRDAWKIEESQYRRIVGELFASAILNGRESVQDTSSIDFRRYDNPLRIANALYEELGEAERETTRKRAHGRYPTGHSKNWVNIPWKKKDPHSDFKAGQDSYSWSSITREQIEETIARFDSSGLRSPTLEWLLVDVSVYAEIRLFGEYVKQQSPAFTRFFGLSYEDARGNLDRAATRHLTVALILATIKLCFLIGVPAYFAWREYTVGHLENAAYIGVASLLAMVAWPHLMKVLGFGKQGESAELTRKMELFSEMCAAYNEITLDRPPRVILKAFDRACAKGACWPGAAWTLLTRAAKDNSGSWGYENRRDGIGAYAAQIENELYNYFCTHLKSDDEVPRPNFTDPDADVEDKISAN